MNVLITTLITAIQNYLPVESPVTVKYKNGKYHLDMMKITRYETKVSGNHVILENGKISQATLEMPLIGGRAKCNIPVIHLKVRLPDGNKSLAKKSAQILEAIREISGNPTTIFNVSQTWETITNIIKSKFSGLQVNIGAICVDVDGFFQIVISDCHYYRGRLKVAQVIINKDTDQLLWLEGIRVKSSKKKQNMRSIKINDLVIHHELITILPHWKMRKFTDPKSPKALRTILEVDHFAVHLPNSLFSIRDLTLVQRDTIECYGKFVWKTDLGDCYFTKDPEHLLTFVDNKLWIHQDLHCDFSTLDGELLLPEIRKIINIMKLAQTKFSFGFSSGSKKLHVPRFHAKTWDGDLLIDNFAWTSLDDWSMDKLSAEYDGIRVVCDYFKTLLEEEILLVKDVLVTYQDSSVQVMNTAIVHTPEIIHTWTQDIKLHKTPVLIQKVKEIQASITHHGQSSKTKSSFPRLICHLKQLKLRQRWHWFELVIQMTDIVLDTHEPDHNLMRSRIFLNNYLISDCHQRYQI